KTYLQEGIGRLAHRLAEDVADRLVLADQKPKLVEITWHNHTDKYYKGRIYLLPSCMSAHPEFYCRLCGEGWDKDGLPHERRSTFVFRFVTNEGLLADVCDYCALRNGFTVLPKLWRDLSEAIGKLMSWGRIGEIHRGTRPVAKGRTVLAEAETEVPF